MTSPAPRSASTPDKLNRRAFTIAAFGLFIPFVGILLGVAGFLLATNAIKRGREAGTPVDSNARNFAILVMVVWGVLWLLVLIPALVRR